jgi:hypothetical protein
MSKISATSESDLLSKRWAERRSALSIAYSDRDARKVLHELRAILNGVSADAVAAWSSSYWHPLGFFRLDIGSDDAGLRYGIDVWPTGFRSTQQPAWLTHRHVWDLESLVLAGALTNFEQDRILRSPKASNVVYDAIVQPGKSILRRTQQELELREVSEEEIRSGRFYRVDIGRFHATDVPLNSYAATLVRRGPKLRPYSQVAGPHRGPEELTYERIRVTTDTVSIGLQLALSED